VGIPFLPGEKGPGDDVFFWRMDLGIETGDEAYRSIIINFEKKQPPL